MKAQVLVLLLLSVTLSGCLGGDDSGVDKAEEDTATLAPAPTHHPYPDGDEGWPEDMTGPFELGGTITDPIESHDGVMLETTIYVPDLPAGVKAPVVVWSLPYPGMCYGDLVPECMEASDSDFIYEGGYARLNPSLLIENGFAVAISNTRGTGHSGGCFAYGGADEQQDQVVLVEHLAEQSWSNGHVAIYGHSYHGFTPWMAAVNAPEALKTIIASGLITDPYTFYHSPQGAAGIISGAHASWYSGILGLAPPLGGGIEHGAEQVGNAPARLCPGVVEAMTESGKGQFTDIRDAAFWDERRLIDRFPDVTSAVLVSQGFRDANDKAYTHTMQDDDVWQSLPENLPKRQIFGQWEHDLPPPPEYLEHAPFGSDWYEDTALPWLDYWLKGIGHPALVHTGEVHYQDQSRDWHGSTAWPPAEARNEVLYFAGDGAMATAPEDGARSFVSTGLRTGGCTDESTNSVVYVTEPLDEAVMVAGNPWAYLRLESNQPGGIVSLDLGKIAGDAACDDGLELISNGAADLRFHEGNYDGRDFPLLDPSPVRVDLYNNAYTVEAGERIVVRLDAGSGVDSYEGQPWAALRSSYQSQPWEPLITIHGGTGPEASHIVLPIIEGTLGGAAPTLEYPPQPFLPDGAR